MNPHKNGCRINMGAYGNTETASVSTFDPDNDGLYSYCEVRAGTNALHPDTDFDGIKDGYDTEPLNHLVPFSSGVNLSIKSDFSDPDVFDGRYVVESQVNVYYWSSAEDIDWQRLNGNQVFYKLKDGNRTIQSGSIEDGKISCNLVNKTCNTQVDLNILSGNYTLSLQIKDRDGLSYQASKAITVTQ